VGAAVLPTQGRLFWAVWLKNSAAEEKKSAPSNFPFVKAFFVFRNKIVFVCIGRNIIIFLGLVWNKREEE
jgi:hypothetical protein